MSWFQRLYETYENCVKASKKNDFEIAPIAHTHKVCNIEIELDEKAEMVDAQVVNEDTIIPTTDENNCMWSLAVDIKTYQKEKDKKDKELKVTYKKQLNEWADISSNIKIQIVNKYIQKNTLIQDLEKKGILWLGGDGKFIEKPKNKKDVTDKYKIFQFVKKQEDVFIRWIVGTDKNRNTWEYNTEDNRIVKSWIDFRKKKLEEENKKSKKNSVDKSKKVISETNQINKEDKVFNNMCYITGDYNALIAIKHPMANGSSKLISSQDDINFIFNGRFIEQNEALNIGFDVTNQAHKVLEWFVSDERKQAYRNYPQIIVAFTINGKDGNVGEVFGKDFVKSIKGYDIKFEQFEQNENIVILEIAASKGRACITYYREMASSQYLKNIENWHKKYYWQQFLKIKNEGDQSEEYKYKCFNGTPSINTIANTYFYKKDKYSVEKKEQKIKSKLIRDLMPSVLENKDIPEYIERHFIEKASNPVALNNGQWKTILRIACSIYKGNHLYVYDENKKEEDYLMSIDEKCKDRNYLYGRLLAVIDDAEKSALLKQKKENSSTKEAIRSTNAQRLMRQFSIKPFETWKVLYEKFNDAYKKRVNGYWIDKKIVDVKDKFTSIEEFKNNSKLTGLYLLGYFHQLKTIEDERKVTIQNKKVKELTNDNIEQKN
jgi:CRISPR-associated protein Csd1